MKRLQAESSARHGILIESLNGLETVRAIGAEAKVQTGWGAFGCGNSAVQRRRPLVACTDQRQRCNAGHKPVVDRDRSFLILDGKLSVGALVAANMLSGCSRADAGLLHHTRDTNNLRSAFNRSPDVVGAGASPRQDFRRTRNPAGLN
jgi:hypothetical protein